MDRAEATGFGVAAAGHVALLAALTLGFANAVHPPIMNQPMEVEFVDAVAIESTAPSPAQAEPAPRLAAVEGPPETAPPLPLPLPEPAPLPEPKAAEPPPQPRPAPPKARPKPPEAKAATPKKAAPAKAPPAKPAAAKAKAEPKGERSAGRLSGILSGISDRETKSRSTATPAAKAGPAVQASLAGAIRRQLKPHWKAPTGADAEQLRTVLEVRLARDGSIIGQPRLVSQTGLTASNRSQAGLHEEQAIRAVRLAAPFDLPTEYSDAWKVIRPGFDKRLSQ